MNERLAFRASADDAANLAAVADTLRTPGRGAFVSTTNSIKAALEAAAHLAREGALQEVLAAAKAR